MRGTQVSRREIAESQQRNSRAVCAKPKEGGICPWNGLVVPQLQILRTISEVSQDQALLKNLGVIQRDVDT